MQEAVLPSPLYISHRLLSLHAGLQRGSLSNGLQADPCRTLITSHATSTPFLRTSLSLSTCSWQRLCRLFTQQRHEKPSSGAVIRLDERNRPPIRTPELDKHVAGRVTTGASVDCQSSMPGRLCRMLPGSGARLWSRKAAGVLSCVT